MTKTTPENLHQNVAKYMLIQDVLPVVVDLDKSRGNRIVDSKTTRTFLDCISYIASNPIGHNHPGILEKNFSEKLLRAARTKPSLSDFYTQEFGEFVETFANIAKPITHKYLFFIEGGSQGVENALKTSFDWKVRLNQKKYSNTAELGTKVIHFKEAFHGRGGYTVSMTNTTDPKKTKFFPKYSWPRVTNPKIKFPLTESNLSEVKNLEAKSIQEIDLAFKNYGEDISAIIIEPIQGEGGDNHFRKEFHQTLRKIATERDALLIYDEVQSGLGLTGKMWAHQNYDVEADIICFGKKTQVCGISVGARIDSVENHVFKETSRINSTWGGNLVDMVRCQRYLEIIEEEKLVENAKNVGAYLLKNLENLCQSFPNFYSNARGIGLMCAVDIVEKEKRPNVICKLYELGILILPSGVSSLRLRPSLTFSKVEVDELMEALKICGKFFS